MSITVSAKARDTGEISLFGPIEADAAATFDSELQALGNVRRIDMHIHSPGGNVFASLTIFNALKRHRAHVVAHIDGIAASAASFVAMAADEIRIAANSQMMIHDPSGAVQGGSGDMTRMSRLLETLRETMVSAYAERSGMPRSRVEKLMAEETWFTAEEAVEAGLADDIDEAVAVAAMDLTQFGFKHAPKPKTISDYAEAYWDKQHAQGISQESEKELALGGQSAPKRQITDLNTAKYFESWNRLSPLAKAQRGVPE